MRFFGAFTLLVLPLFLLVCIQMIRNSQFKDKIFAKILIAIFALFSLAAVATALYLLFIYA